ncbi:MAG TPA: hypothetical protein VFQ45_13740 [Longimicrobium sp.]|nr:hypothetical protein [Longimicrobium sp.]
MRRSLPLLLLALAACDRPDARAGSDRAAAPDTARDLRGEVPMEFVSHVAITPAGTLWLVGALDQRYTADSITGDWRPAPGTPAEPPEVDWEDPAHQFDFDAQFRLPRPERVDFFDGDTAFGSGRLNAGNLDLHDAIYRTTDGGRTWQPVSFGDDAWIYTVFVGRGGQAWMGGSSGRLHHTRDYARTWTHLSTPFDDRTRLKAIHVEPDGFAIAGALGNAIKLTTDGGRTWRAVPTPRDQRAGPLQPEEGEDGWTEAVAVVGGRLLALQDGSLFHSAREPVRWQHVPGVAVLVRDPWTGDLYGLDAERRPLRIHPDLRVERLSDEPLHARPRHLAAHRGTLYALDEDEGLFAFRPGRRVYTRPVTSAHRVRRVDRARHDGSRLWGATAHHVYGSDDGGRTWHRLAMLPFPAAGLALAPPDEALLWDGRGAAVRVARGGRRARPVETLRGWDVVGVIQTDTAWYAYGGRRHEAAERTDAGQTFYGGGTGGTRPHGFLLASRDRGRTWSRVDEWAEGGAAAVFVHPTGQVTLFSYLGGVRRLEPADGGFRARNVLLPTDGNARRMPYVQVPTALHFDAGGRAGFVDGTVHNGVPRRFRTADGGATWRQEEPPQLYVGMVSVPGGHAAWTRDAVRFLGPDAEREVFRLPADVGIPAPRISEVSAAPGGRLLVDVRDGRAYYLVDPAAGTSRRLR